LYAHATTLDEYCAIGVRFAYVCTHLG
jgi:hypothetical protein